MVQYSPLFVIFNALIFSMWAVTFCCTLTRRFSVPVTILGFFIQFFVWLVPPYFMQNASILRAVYPLIGIVLPLFLLFRDKWPRILFITLGCLVFMYVADLVPCVIIFTPEQMRAGLALQPLPQRLVAYAICVSLDAFLLWMLTLFMNRYKNRLHGSEWALYLLFPFSQYMLLFGWFRVCLSEMTFPRAGYVIAAMLVCMAADAALYLAVRGMAQRSELKAKNDLLPAQINRQKEHYAAITAQYESIRRMRHDIAKHLFTMQTLLQAGQYQNAATYSDEVAAHAAAYSDEVAAHTEVRENLGICEDPIVDAFLFSRSQELEKQGYRVQLRVLLPEGSGVAESDLIVAFANLLDNAAEACRACSDKTITLTAAINKGFLTIETENACEQTQIKKRRIPELERGIGFSIFQELAQRYNGRFSYHKENGRFTASLILKGVPLAQSCNL